MGICQFPMAKPDSVRLLRRDDGSDHWERGRAEARTSGVAVKKERWVLKPDEMKRRGKLQKPIKRTRQTRKGAVSREARISANNPQDIRCVEKPMLKDLEARKETHRNQ